MNDNRNYRYHVHSVSRRNEYQKIVDLIPVRSKVIDLGCGDGTLMKLLEEKGVITQGIDLSSTAVKAAQKKNLKVTKGRIDKRLPFKDKSFDFAVSSVTVQMVMYPEKLLFEMKRIAYKQIISFPNFAFILNRFDLLVFGRMPKIMIPGYDWYSTGHIHQLSIRDFKDFCAKNNLTIISQMHNYPKQLGFIPRFILGLFPNHFATLAIFITK